MHDKPDQNEPQTTVDRWTLIRDVAVFQVKLLFDGLRDVLLVPVSLIAGLISVFKSGDQPGPEFYDLLKFGRRSERWINLFGAAGHYHGPAADDEDLLGEDIDDLVSRVETFVIDEYQKGGVTAQAKDRLDGAINALQRLRRGQDKQV